MLKVQKNQNARWVIVNELGEVVSDELSNRNEAREVLRLLKVANQTTEVDMPNTVEEIIELLEPEFTTQSNEVDMNTEEVAVEEVVEEVVEETATEEVVVEEPVTEEVVVETAAVEEPVTKEVKPARKSDLIRGRIKLVIDNKEENAEEAVIRYGVDVLGMKRALARAYVKNNWSKVA